jgi:hypothetical protein
MRQWVGNARGDQSVRGMWERGVGRCNFHDGCHEEDLTTLLQSAIELSRPKWREVQQALNDIGFDAGPADGVPGDKARAAITLFQKSRGFSPGW